MPNKTNLDLAYHKNTTEWKFHSVTCETPKQECNNSSILFFLQFPKLSKLSNNWQHKLLRKVLLFSTSNLRCLKLDQVKKTVLQSKIFYQSNIHFYFSDFIQFPCRGFLMSNDWVDSWSLLCTKISKKIFRHYSFSHSDFLLADTMKL